MTRLSLVVIIETSPRVSRAADRRKSVCWVGVVSSGWHGGGVPRGLGS